MERSHAPTCFNACSDPTGRAASGARQVVGIGGRAEERVGRLQIGKHLGDVGLADDDRTGRAQSGDSRCIGAARAVAIKGGSPRWRACPRHRNCP